MSENILKMPVDSETTKFLKRFGRHLRDLRQAKGWTLEEVEEHGDIAWRHLQKLEQGKNLTVGTARKLAKLYNLRLSELFEGIDRQFLSGENEQYGCQKRAGV